MEVAVDVILPKVHPALISMKKKRKAQNLFGFWMWEWDTCIFGLVSLTVNCNFFNAQNRPNKISVVDGYSNSSGKITVYENSDILKILFHRDCDKQKHRV